MFGLLFSYNTKIVTVNNVTPPPPATQRTQKARSTLYTEVHCHLYCG
jgi:hypothetical protein